MILDIFQKFLIMMIIFVPLEHLLPIHKKKALRSHWKVDLGYALGVVFITSFGILSLIVVSLIISELFVPQTLKTWVSELPLLVQISAIMIIADIGYYWIHRMFHEVPALWHYHAVHHSIEEMDWLAAHRVHPIDQIMTRGVSLIIPYALGFTPAAFASWGIFFSLHSYLKHSNVNIPFGPLRWILASPIYHHWHHANIERAFDKNYAGQLPVLDIIFNTAIMDRDAPDKYGTDHPVSNHLGWQLLNPILKRTEN